MKRNINSRQNERKQDEMVQACYEKRKIEGSNSGYENERRRKKEEKKTEKVVVRCS